MNKLSDLELWRKRNKIVYELHRAIWTILHDVIAHPICGILWVLQFKNAGNWIHEATIPPLRWEDLNYDVSGNEKVSQDS